MEVDMIYGYTYGNATVANSPVSLDELERLKVTVGFGEEDKEYLALAGEVLAGQTRQIVQHWRSGIIAKIAHLAQHSKNLEGEPIPHYLESSNRRFEQWILDTCLRPYDQDWLNYQYEIALRHTSRKKNEIDAVASTPYVPLRDIIGFIAIMNETLKPYLAARGHSAETVAKMHLAWCKSLQLQAALFVRPYSDPGQPAIEW